MDPATPLPFLARLQDLLGTRDYGAARRLCEDVLGASGSRAPADRFLARLSLGRIAFVEGRRGEARRHADALRRAAPDAAGLVMTGDLYGLLGARLQAAACWEQALRDFPDSLLPHQRLYDHHRDHEDEARARVHLDAFLAGQPDNPWGRRELAGLRFNEGDWEGAFDLYEGLPGAFDAHSCGEVRFRQGRIDEARKWYRLASTRAPEAPWPHYRLAVLEAADGDPAGALRWLDLAPPGPWGLEDLRAHLLERLGDRAGAEAARAGALVHPELSPVFERRLREIEEGRCVLHGYLERHEWGRIRLRLVTYLHRPERAAVATPSEDIGERVTAPMHDEDRGGGTVPGSDGFVEKAVQLAERVVAFHRREFGASGRIAIVSTVARTGSRPYAWFRDAIAHEGARAMCRELGIARQRPGEAVLLLWWDPEVDEPLSQGYGGRGYAAVQCAWSDACLAAIATHELYHATLGLPHTDGEKDILDCAGIMGWPGTQNRLEDTFIGFQQKACCATLPRAGRLVRRARRAEEEGRWEEAARAYREALEVDPIHPYALVHLSLVETHRGRYREALEVLERKARINPSAMTTAGRAQILLDLGRKGEAARVLAQARGYGSSERTHWVAGAAYARSWYLRDALREFRRARALRPACLHSHMNEAALLHLCGEFDEARRMYEEALEADPAWGDAWDNLAILSARTGDLPRARRCLRRAGPLQGDSAAHGFATVRVRSIEGRFDGLPRLLERALEKEPFTVMYLCWKGYAHLVLGEPEQALREWRRCAETERLSPWGRVAGSWAWLLEGGGPRSEWERRWRRIRQLDGRNSGVPLVVHLRAVLEHHLGLPGTSRCLDRLRVLLPRHPWTRERLLTPWISGSASPE